MRIIPDRVYAIINMRSRVFSLCAMCTSSYISLTWPMLDWMSRRKKRHTQPERNSVPFVPRHINQTIEERENLLRRSKRSSFMTVCCCSSVVPSRSLVYPKPIGMCTVLSVDWHSESLGFFLLPALAVPFKVVHLPFLFGFSSFSTQLHTHTHTRRHMHTTKMSSLFMSTYVCVCVCAFQAGFFSLCALFCSFHFIRLLCSSSSWRWFSRFESHSMAQHSAFHSDEPRGCVNRPIRSRRKEVFTVLSSQLIPITSIRFHSMFWLEVAFGTRTRSILCSEGRPTMIKWNGNTFGRLRNVVRMTNKHKSVHFTVKSNKMLVCVFSGASHRISRKTNRVLWDSRHR